MPPDHADNYFYATVSKDARDQAFSQTLDLSKIAAAIDIGKINYNFGGWFGVRGGSAAGRLRVTFYGDKENLITPTRSETDATESITTANRPDDVTMIEKTRSGDVPVGTRKIKITLEIGLFANRAPIREMSQQLMVFRLS